MPHLTLEYSANIIEKDNLLDLFPKCHAILVSSLPAAKLEACKSRAFCSDIYYIANGRPEYAFIHLDVKVMAGRSDENLQIASQQLLELLTAYFSASMKKYKLQISVEISELGKHFLKITS